ncbi:MAG: sugar phosphate isomerase/epimerase family protein [Pseudomonadota bacterium]
MIDPPSLQLYRTLWGWNGDYATAAREAAEAGFDGLEGPAPADPERRQELSAALRDHGLTYIAEITTAGSYVPDRRATVEEHLSSLVEKLGHALELNPKFVTCIGGCDAWPFSRSLRFFREAILIAESSGTDICFETHRSRSLFNPWITVDIARALPAIRFTFDYSHWCVVCERLLDSEADVLRELAPYARHIHARVGYDQGPQVPHPAAPEHAHALAAHQRWWENLWTSMAARGEPVLTMTPEFGPDGYLHCEPFSGKPVADLWEINCWMAHTEREHYLDWTARLRMRA